MLNNLVSIIVPVYNSEKYLDATIKSVLQQTYCNWELIIVNDGSSDDSDSICRSYAEKDHRIVYIEQQNAGVSAARNTGIASASGVYLTFLDSDDELATNAVELLVTDIEKYNADIASASKYIITSDGEQLDNYGDGELRIYNKDEMIVQSLLYGTFTRACHAKLFRNDFLTDIRFIEGHNINEDGYFLFQCYAKSPKLVQHNISIYKYYQRENSASHGEFSDKYFDMIYFCNLKMKYIQDNKPYLLEYAKDMEVRTHLRFLDVLCRTKDITYKEYVKKSIEVVRIRFLKFRAVSKHEKKLAIIVTFGLYPLYKFLYRVKFAELV